MGAEDGWVKRCASTIRNFSCPAIGWLWYLVKSTGPEFETRRTEPIQPKVLLKSRAGFFTIYEVTS
jgi:hypothetical protein